MKFLGVLLKMSEKTIEIYEHRELSYEFTEEIRGQLQEILGRPKKHICEFEMTPRTRVVFSVTPVGPSDYVPEVDTPINTVTVTKPRKVPAYPGKKLGSVSIGAKIKTAEHEGIFVQVEGDEANAVLAHLNDILDTIGAWPDTRMAIESYQAKVLKPRKE